MAEKIPTKRECEHVTECGKFGLKDGKLWMLGKDGIECGHVWGKGIEALNCAVDALEEELRIMAAEFE